MSNTFLQGGGEKMFRDGFAPVVTGLIVIKLNILDICWWKCSRERQSYLLEL